MNRLLPYHRSIRILTALSLVAAHQAFAVAPQSGPSQQPDVHPVDVMLGSEGMLHGYVVDAQGVPAAGIEVQLSTSTGEKITTNSDEKGRFGYRGLTGGSYQLQTEHGVVVCRAWTPNAAPPSSAATLLLVHDGDLVRGQWSAPPAVNGTVSKLKRAMTNPFFVATVVGAAVAIPVAVHNANKDDSSS